MINPFTNEMNKFRLLNKLANANGTAIIGSSFFQTVPVNELKQTFNVNCDLYNRSISELTLAAAKDLVQMTITELNPRRILLQLGETDLERGYLTIDEMMNQYKIIIEMIKKIDKHCKIVLVSVCENEYQIQPEKFNSELSKLAATYKCQYADISSASYAEIPQIKAFRSLKYFMTGSFTFGDAFDNVISSANKEAGVINNEISPSLT